MAGDEEVEAVRRAIRSAWDDPLGANLTRWGTMAEAAIAALDRVRSRPPSGTEGEDHEAGWSLDRCGECGRKGGDGVLLLISDVTKHPPLCFKCRDLWYPPVSGTKPDTAKAMLLLLADRIWAGGEVSTDYGAACRDIAQMIRTEAGFSVDAEKPEED